MKLARPYPENLEQVARKVAWYDPPEQTLDNLPDFLAKVMVYGSPSDIALVGSGGTRGMD